LAPSHDTYQGRITITRDHVACISLRWNGKQGQEEEGDEDQEGRARAGGEGSAAHRGRTLFVHGPWCVAGWWPIKFEHVPCIYVYGVGGEMRDRYLPGRNRV
jgi:hypothetical protein